MKRVTCFAVLATLFFSADAWAQKGYGNDAPTGIFDSRADYDQFMGSVKQAAYGEGGSAELQAMIPMLNDLVLEQPFGTTAERYNTADMSNLGLLFDPKIREEINLVDEQYEELQKMNLAIQARSTEQLKNLDFSDRESLLSHLKEIREAARSDLESLFIPEQLERLKQLRNQRQMRGGSLVDIITANPLKDELEISDEQVEQLRAAEEEVEEEIQRELLKLRAKARDRILGRLNAEQREEVEEMYGDLFAFSPRETSKHGKAGRAGRNAGKNGAGEKAAGKGGDLKSSK